MKVLDLFSGIGGFSLGLEWAGMSTVAFCERDPYCTTILNKHWPDTPVHSDVRNLDGKEYADSIDLVAGGFPCQPFSVAGNRRGSDDDRHLWPEMLRIIQEAKPRWVIGENVFGLINMALDDVQADLEREHYEVRKFVLPAVAVDAHHRRDRIFIIAYRDPALADSNGKGLEVRQGIREKHAPQLSPSERSGSERREDVAYTNGARGEVGISGQESWQEGYAGESHDQGDQQLRRSPRGEWPAEPRVGRVADGIPNRVDRIRGLGNAVVPQLIQAIGELVLAADKEIYG